MLANNFYNYHTMRIGVSRGVVYGLCMQCM